MARYIGPNCRICRREGDALFLKGTRCYSEKCAMKKRNKIPGMHGGKMMKKSTGYSLQLRAKQRVRRIYGILEKQFENYYSAAVKQTGNSGINLLRLIESRLDNVVYRMGFALSRAQSRMWVTHAHFNVNGKAVNIPSFIVRPGDVISVKTNSSVKKKVKDILEKTSRGDNSPWLEIDKENFKCKFLALPERAQLDPAIQESLIIEYYSR